MAWRPEWWKSLPQKRIQRKERKEMKTASETSRTRSNAPTLALQRSQKEKKERKDLSRESPRQDKPKEEHTETHSNETDKD